MLLAVISDIHDNLVNLTKALRLINSRGAEVLLCLGDVAEKETLDFLAQSFAGRIYLVRGNACLYSPADTALKNLTYLGRQGGVIEAGNLKLGLCHEPELIADLLKTQPVVVFYGHTHKPWYEEKDGCLLINPGNISNFGYPPTFAFFETATKQLELIRLDDLPNPAK